MNFTLNTWSTPEVAKTWPEGSQIVWRIPLSIPRLNKTHSYGESDYLYPELIGEVYQLDHPGMEFMLLELPLTESGMAG